jgi:hypothetical protein
MSDFLQAARFTDRQAPEPHQMAAWNYAWKLLDAEQQKKFFEIFRAAPESKEPLSWAVIANMAKQAGARHPELVAAQWAQESGWGKHVSGKNNYFGIKGTPGTTRKTFEYKDGRKIETTATFKDYSSTQESVADLVNLWYKDYKSFKGVNNASDRNAAAMMLQAQGYATDPQYGKNLIALMDKHAQQVNQPPTAKLRPDSSFSLRITPHIRLGEFALDQEARRFHHQYQLDTAAELAAFMERCRIRFGNKPVVISSGYRPPAINKAVNGASSSEHLYSSPGVGAVDFYIKGESIKAVQDWCDANWPYSLGYGAPKGFVHLGIRAGKPRVRWDY